MIEADKKRIQIVEDEGVVADEIRIRLKNLGYEVVGTADTGPGAIQMAEEKRPDLVLMDIMLKGTMDGVEAAGIIRDTYDIPVVYLTAYADDGTLGRARVTKPFGYLIKPFQERELRSTIEISLHNHMMERRLAESEARYRAVSELSSDYAFSLKIGDDGTITLEWITDAFYTITGMTPDAMKDLAAAQQVIHPDDVSLFGELLGMGPEDTALITRAMEGIDFRIITTRGELRWMHGFLRPVWNDDETRLVRCYGAVKDITLTKRAQDLIRIQRDLAIALSMVMDLTAAFDELLGTLIQVSGIDCGALYLVDPHTGEMELAAHRGLPYHFIDILHYDSGSPQTRLALAGEPIYGSYSELSSPLEDLPDTDELKALALIPVKYEGRVVAALNLASRTIHGIPPDARDALETIAMQVGGIIARVRAEMALRENEEKYRLITEAVSEGIVLVNRDGKVTYANEGFLNRIRASVVEVRGTGFERWLKEMHIPEFRVLIEDVLYGNFYETVMWLRAKDGNEFRVYIGASPLRDAGAVREIIMVMSHPNG